MLFVGLFIQWGNRKVNTESILAYGLTRLLNSHSVNGDMSGYILKLRGLGRLRGVVERSVDGGSYLAFKGVPYAKPPLGRLRFAVSFMLRIFEELIFVKDRCHIRVQIFLRRDTDMADCAECDQMVPDILN